MSNNPISAQKRWEISPPLPSDVNNNLSQFPPTIRQILFNRGISSLTEAERYFMPKPLGKYQKYSLLGIEQAADRIGYAIRNQERIVVYGDYDVDGVTATALLTQALLILGADEVQPYIPNRFDEGYGLNLEALSNLSDEGTDLIITVDCGIRSLEEVEQAKKMGMDTIISDHHHPGEELPAAIALINPKQPGDPYPDKDLAGVGIAYKIIQALIPYMEARHLHEEEFLDLVALGTVADLAPLVGENRSLVQKGLNTIKYTKRQGLLSLMRVARVNPNKILAADIGFALGPRLNAAGRLDSAFAALELLLTQDVFRAGLLAQQLDDQNKERQKITKEIQQRAEQIAFQESNDAYVLFAADPEFNPGVVGLAASKLMEKYYRPAIVAHIDTEETRASCRSIPEFHITEALDECADLLTRHGGHAAAAGFTVINQNLPELQKRLSDIAHRKLSSKELKPSLYADIEISLRNLTPDLLNFLEKMEPTGYGNLQPHFISRNLFIDPDPRKTRAVGKDGSHLKLTVTDGLITYDAIAFRQGSWIHDLPHKVDLLYTFEVNEYNGRSSLQLNVKDIKPSE